MSSPTTSSVSASKDIAGFLREIEPLIVDRFLDRAEERALYLKATRFGLDHEEASRCIVALCEGRQTTIERLAAEELQRLVQCAIADGFLDQGERKALREYGRDLFARAPGRVELVDRLIAEEVEHAGAWTEDELASTVQRGLDALATPRGEIRGADWQALRQRQVRRAAERGVDLAENDVGAMVERQRENRRLEVQPAAGPHSRIGRLATAAVLLSAVAAVGWWLWPRGGGDAFDLPPCDVACEKELRRLFGAMNESAAALNFTDPGGLLDRAAELDARCEPFAALDPARQTLAKDRIPAWKWCDHPSRPRLFVKGEAYYLEQVDTAGRSGTPCEPLGRCLQLVPDSSRCRELAVANDCAEAGR